MLVRRGRIGVWLFAGIFVSAHLGAQMAAKKGGGDAANAVKPKLETRTLDLSQGEPIIGMPPPIATAAPLLCSSDGDIFPLVYTPVASGQVSVIPDVYGISPQRAVKHLTIPLPKNFKYTRVENFFPGKYSAVYLVEGIQPQGAAADADSTKYQYFLTRTDRDGDSPEVVKLELPFEVGKVAVFDTGDVLVLGANTTDLYPVLALLHSDGRLNRILNFDDRAYRDATLSAGTSVARPDESNTTALRRVVLGSLFMAQLIPWGSEILLVQPGSNLPVYRISSAGAVTQVKVALPGGLLLATIEGSGERDTWLAIARSVDSFRGLNSGKVVENLQEHMFEIDPYTGDILRALEVEGPRALHVVCGADHRATAIYFGERRAKDKSDQPMNDGPGPLMYASAPR